MDRRQKKGINFALDTEALKEHDTKRGWHNAYYDVRPFSRIRVFEHIHFSYFGADYNNKHFAKGR